VSAKVKYLRIILLEWIILIWFVEDSRVMGLRKFKSSKVQKFKSSKVPKFKSSKVSV